MSDGPVKPTLEIEPEPLDDIILGEDDDDAEAKARAAERAPAKPAPPPGKAAGSVPPKGADVGLPNDTASKPPPAKRPSSGRTKAAAAVDGATDAKKRAKMTLRIPDDEISRPQLPATTPAGGVPAIGASASASTSGSRPPPAFRDDRFDEAPPIQPQRIVSFAPPPNPGADDTVELPADEVRARMAAITNESSADGTALGIDTTTEKGWTPYAPAADDGANHASHARNGGATIVDVHERIPAGPPSEDIPIVTDDVSDPSGDSLETRPRLPADSEEIRIDEGESESESGRITDPEAMSELDADDLVSVESMPRPGKTAGRFPAFKATGAAAALGATPNAPAVAVHVPPPARPISATASAPAMTPASPPVAPAAAPPPVAPTSSSSSNSTGVAAAPAATPSKPAPPPTSAPTSPRASSPDLPAIKTPSGIVVPNIGGLAPPPMTETAAMRKKGRPWWEDLFNDDFIRTMAKISESQIKGEVDFIEESLGCEAGAMVLDLACGTGRHAVELAARGYQVVGFDLSLAMLARASDEAQDRKQKINFVQGDMRDMTFEETFDGVYAWNTSFGYFDEEKNAAVIAKVHKSLKKGGQFLLDVINRDYVVRQAPSLAWFEGEGCICMDEMQIDFITSRLKVKRTLMMDDGRTKEIEYSIRVYALHELGKMLHDNGFRVAEVSGKTATPGVFFGCESPRTLILAEKR